MSSTSTERKSGLSADRVKQLIVVIGIAAAADILRNALTGQWSDLAILGLSSIPLCFAWGLVNFGRTELAGQLVLFAVTCMVNAFVWRNAGLQEPAVVAYPTVLMLAGLLFGQRAMLALLALITSFLVALTIADYYGWHSSAAPGTNVASTLSMTGILAVSAAIIWMVKGDFK
ncbi:MAG: hypothetical protein JO370_15830, partial [Paucibacter sp.]|nr:hypothetical protein [Roseateles sp.]